MKIESQEMKWIALTFLVHPLLILMPEPLFADDDENSYNTCDTP
jgi:K+-transporting ATPase A subunit